MLDTPGLLQDMVVVQAAVSHLAGAAWQGQDAQVTSEGEAGVAGEPEAVLVPRTLSLVYASASCVLVMTNAAPALAEST